MNTTTLTAEDSVIFANHVADGITRDLCGADSTDYRVMRDHFELKQKSGFTPDERIRQFTTWDQVSA